MQLGSLSRLLFAAAIFTFPRLSIAQAVTRPLQLHSALQDKDFYLLSALQAESGVRALLTGDKMLSQISAERQQFLTLALQTCKGDAVCTLRALVWTEEEIRIVSFALARIYQDNSSLRELVDKNLRPSGAYVLYQKQSGEGLLVNAWEVCARGLNNIIAVYGQGAAPRYPLIDSISFDVNSADFRQRIASLVKQIFIETTTLEIFFDPSLKAALQLLALNHRDEAGRLEPMETAANEAAVKAIPSIHWKDYTYSVIVVPGAGPSGLDEAGSNVEMIYKLDKRNAFADVNDQEAREMVYSRTAAGARMLRDIVYRAWLESAISATPDKPSPIDPNNPLYNAQTGSAPAAKSLRVTK
jgi:hypothetical protein